MTLYNNDHQLILRRIEKQNLQVQCAEKLLETMKLLSCWTRHFRSWMTVKNIYMNK